MRVALFHATFDEAGGGERLALSMARALVELGNEVDLYTTHVDPKSWNLIAQGCRLSPRLVPEGALARLVRAAAGPGMTRLRRLLAVRAALPRIRRMLAEGEYDVAVETQSNVPSKLDASYIHFPATIDYMTSVVGSRPGLSRRAYDWAIRRLASSVQGRPLIVMTNSAWTEAKIREAYGDLRVNVVYPPVDVEELGSASRPVRENLVLTVSRFTPEKRLDAIVDVARLVPEATFYIVGSTSSYSRPIIEGIRARADALGVKNVTIETDVPRRRLVELMGSAKVYLHPPFPEHFGIAIAEGAAAGAVPVVYRDGGGWTDIASRVDPMLGYTTVDEAAGIIRDLLADSDKLRRLSSRAVEVAKGFSYSSFKGRVSQVFSELAKLKFAGPSP